MNQVLQLHQNKSNQRSFIITGITMATLLLILFIITLPKPPVEEVIESVILDFGQTEDGLGDDELREAGGQGASAPQQAASLPEPTTTKTSSAPVSTPKNSAITAVDPQAVAIAQMQKEEQIRQKAALLEQQRIAEAIKKAEKERLAREAEAQAAKDQVAAAWTKGKNTKGTGNGTGTATGNGPGNGQGNTVPGGNQGSPNGSPGGDPKGTGASYNLAGRTWKPHMIIDNTQKTGKVVVMIKVDKTGKVLYAKYQQKGSTTTDADLIRLAEEGAIKTKFSANSAAVEEQVGTITYKFGFSSE